MKYTLDNLKKADRYLTLAVIQALPNNSDNVDFKKMGEQYIKHLGLKSTIIGLENGYELDDDELGSLDFLFSEPDFKQIALMINKEESQDDNVTSNS